MTKEGRPSNQESVLSSCPTDINLVQSDGEIVHRNREDIKPMPNTREANSTPTAVEEARARESSPDATKTPAMPTQTPARRASSRTIKPPARF